MGAGSEYITPPVVMVPPSGLVAIAFAVPTDRPVPATESDNVTDPTPGSIVSGVESLNKKPLIDNVDVGWTQSLPQKTQPLRTAPVSE